MSPKQRRTGLVLILLLALACASSMSASSRAASAPLNFKLRTTDGGEITSEMLRGDVVVLAFGSSLLGPLSKEEAQQAQELADHFAPQNVRVYFVCTDSDAPKSRTYATDEQIRAFAHKNGLKVAVLRDPDSALFKRTGADQLPAIVILDRAGEISGSPIGGLDPNPPQNRRLVNLLADRLNALLGAK
jgi:peroxiredoxin